MWIFFLYSSDKYHTTIFYYFFIFLSSFLFIWHAASTPIYVYAKINANKACHTGLEQYIFTFLSELFL